MVVLISVNKKATTSDDSKLRAMLLNIHFPVHMYLIDQGLVS